MYDMKEGFWDERSFRDELPSSPYEEMHHKRNLQMYYKYALETSEKDPKLFKDHLFIWGKGIYSDACDV